MFDVKQLLLDDKIPSLGLNVKKTPAYLGYEGIKRVAKGLGSFQSSMK